MQFLTASQPMPSQFPQSRSPLSTLSFHMDNSSQFYCSARNQMSGNISMVSLGQLSCLCPLPSSCAASPPFQPSSMRSQQSLTQCKHCSVTTLMCYQHYFHPKCKTQHFTSLTLSHLQQNTDLFLRGKFLPEALNNFSLCGSIGMD